MRKIAYWLALLFVIVANGTILSLDNDVFTSLTRIFALPAIGAWLLVLLTERRIRNPQTFQWLFFLFVAWNAASLMWTYDTDSTMERIKRYVDYLIALAVFWSAFREAKQVEGAMQAFVLGVYITVGGLVINFFRGSTYYSANSRFSSMAFHPDDTGLILGIAMPIAWYLGHSGRHLSKWWRGVNFAYPFVAAGAIILTGTRGALVSVIPAVIYMIFSFRKFTLRWRMIVFGAAVLVLLLLARLDLSQQMSRLASITESISGGSGGDRLNGRLDVWEAGWDVFTKNPVLGVGGGAFPVATLSYGLPSGDHRNGIIAHNTYLSVLSETGIVGILLFGGILATIISALRRCPKGERGAFVASFCVWAIGAFELSFEFRWQTWLLFMLIMVASAATEKQRLRQPAVNPRRLVPQPQPGSLGIG